jgi:putative protein-disulfide isomerase
MTAPTLHYVHDPLCGWCYAVTPMIDAVAQAGIGIVLHGGGLWEPATGPTPEKRAYIRQNDARIAALTGMTFGPAYLDGLLADATTVFWSIPTIAAVLAAGTVEEGADLKMMHAIQHAHYVNGRRVVETPVLTEAAVSVGLAEDAFLHAFQRAPVDEHVARTRRWMQQLGLHGFPSFVLEHDAKLVRVQHEPFYGRPAAFLHAVNAAAAAPAAA